jgi:hypothetical protein
MKGVQLGVHFLYRIVLTLKSFYEQFDFCFYNTFSIILFTRKSRRMTLEDKVYQMNQFAGLEHMKKGNPDDDKEK